MDIEDSEWSPLDGQAIPVVLLLERWLEEMVVAFCSGVIDEHKVLMDIEWRWKPGTSPYWSAFHDGGLWWKLHNLEAKYRFRVYDIPVW